MAKSNDTKDVYLAIKYMIKQGVFAPNEKLNQIKLAEHLKVSRTPVATALHMLASEGYLDQIHNSGFFVHTVTLKEVLELLLARASLESMAAFDLAENADDETLEHLSKAFIELENLPRTEDQESRMNFLKVDRHCHKALLNSCKNTWITRMNDSIRILERPNALGMLRDQEEVLEEHKTILAAILNRDPLAAQTAAACHIHHTRKLVMDTAHNLEKMGMDTSQLFRISQNPDMASNY